MEVKQAVAAAKLFLVEVMGDEPIDPPTLEEVWLEDKKTLWRVTLGVRRKLPPESAAGRLGLSQLPDYKTVTISNRDGKLVSIRNRLLQSLETWPLRQSIPIFCSSSWWGTSHPAT